MGTPKIITEKQNAKFSDSASDSASWVGKPVSPFSSFVRVLYLLCAKYAVTHLGSWTSLSSRSSLSSGRDRWMVACRAQSSLGSTWGLQTHRGSSLFHGIPLISGQCCRSYCCHRNWIQVLIQFALMVWWFDKQHFYFPISNVGQQHLLILPFPRFVVKLGRKVRDIVTWSSE